MGSLILLGWTTGVCARSRTCAVTLLVLYLVDKTILFMVAEGPVIPVVPAVIADFLWLGGQGTFAYHRLTKESA